MAIELGLCMGREERIRELEAELAKTKVNKRTEGSLGLLKAKISRLKDETDRKASGKGKGSGYAVKKSGDATVVLLGFPSVGKSTLLNSLCNTHSKVAAYAFTTLNVVPGAIEHKHAKIQILDVPGIVYGAASGRGRGKEVLGVIKSSDLVLMVVDAQNPEQYNALCDEVKESNIRVNQEPPQVTIKRKPRGGIDVGTRVRLTKIDTDTVKTICRELGVLNADVLIKEDLDMDRFIDAIESNRSYLPAVVVVNKADLLSDEDKDLLRREIKPDLFISAHAKMGLTELKDLIFERIGFIRIFLKQAGKKADMEEPLIMRRGATVRDICTTLHRDFVRKFRFARLWGPSAKFDGQMVRNLDKFVQDGDIVELHIS